MAATRPHESPLHAPLTLLRVARPHVGAPVLTSRRGSARWWPLRRPAPGAVRVALRHVLSVLGVSQRRLRLSLLLCVDTQTAVVGEVVAPVSAGATHSPAQTGSQAQHVAVHVHRLARRRS